MTATTIEVEESDNRPVLNLLTKRHEHRTTRVSGKYRRQYYYERPVQIFPLLEGSKHDFTMLRESNSLLELALHCFLFVPLFYLMFPFRLALSIVILPFVLLSGVKGRDVWG